MVDETMLSESYTFLIEYFSFVTDKIRLKTGNMIETSLPQLIYVPRRSIEEENRLKQLSDEISNNPKRDFDIDAAKAISEWTELGKKLPHRTEGRYSSENIIEMADNEEKEINYDTLSHEADHAIRAQLLGYHENHPGYSEREIKNNLRRNPRLKFVSPEVAEFFSQLNGIILDQFLVKHEEYKDKIRINNYITIDSLRNEHVFTKNKPEKRMEELLNLYIRLSADINGMIEANNIDILNPKDAKKIEIVLKTNPLFKLYNKFAKNFKQDSAYTYLICGIPFQNQKIIFEGITRLGEFPESFIVHPEMMVYKIFQGELDSAYEKLQEEVYKPYLIAELAIGENLESLKHYWPYVMQMDSRTIQNNYINPVISKINKMKHDTNKGKYCMVA